MEDRIKNVKYAKVYALGQSIKDIFLTWIYLETRINQFYYGIKIIKIGSVFQKLQPFKLIFLKISFF